MGVSKLGVEVELEVLMEVQLSVSHLDVLALALLDDGTSVHRLDDGVNSVLQILDQHWLSSLNGELEGLHHFGVRETGDLKVILLLSFSEPGDTLELGINDQGVSL